MQNNNGFTLVGVLMVLVVLSVLGPKYFDDYIELCERYRRGKG